ncbi:flagellin [Luteimonas composti]|uniref:Flagellin n=1 Tax=Luteimonas composti TaxID=398257 RepID=A0ABT6MNC5_9GAMM|nr:flagellin [Luteimonas composti]MDH7452086.1 flagellin [Luteimonas composti]
MSSVINTNVMSLNAQRNLTSSSAQLATSLQRLSSGMRINSAKDDAAGLAISQRFTTQIRGMDVAARNANDGISLAQTAEGAMTEIGNNLQRIRELAVQSRNATNSASDRAALDKEAQALKAEINRVASQTNFNGVKLLDGSFNNQVFQVGANQGETITVSSIVNANSSALGSYQRATVTGNAATAFTAIDAGDLTINGTSVGPIAADASATARAASVRDAINSVSDTTGVYAVNDTATTITLVSTTADIAVAHAGPSSTAATTGLAAGTNARATSTGFDSLDISTASGADAAMQSMTAALDAINTARASMGAIQNRFTSVVANLSTTSENLSAARSRIQDADFAKESAQLSRNQILQQAGTAMLAQANQATQGVLSLLR